MRHLTKFFLIFIIIAYGNELRADEPSFQLDPDFVYLSGDENSLLSLKYYPEIKSKYEKAFANLRKGLETAAEGVILMNLAYSLGKEEELQKYAKFVLRKDSRKDEARLLLATAAANQSQSDLAQLYLDQITDKLVNDAAENIRGVIAFQQKRPDLAVQILQKALRRDPKNYAVAMNLGLVLMDLQKYGAAEKHFSTVVNQYPNGYDAKLQLAAAMAAQGKKSNATEILEDMTKLFPKSAYLSKMIAIIAKTKFTKK